MSAPDVRPCGCTAGDPHAADCDLLTGGSGRSEADWFAVLSRRDEDDYGDDW